MPPLREAKGATHFLTPHVRRPVRVTALRRAGVFAFEPGPASRQHAPTPEWCLRQEPLGRNGPTAFPLCHKANGPLPRYLRASEPVDPRERAGRMEKCQNKAGCSGFCCCQIRTYDERAGSPTRALMAAETSETTTFDYQTPVQYR